MRIPTPRQLNHPNYIIGKEALRYSALHSA